LYVLCLSLSHFLFPLSHTQNHKCHHLKVHMQSYLVHSQCIPSVVQLSQLLPGHSHPPHLLYVTLHSSFLMTPSNH
jgi:hypothetical protein